MTIVNKEKKPSILFQETVAFFLQTNNAKKGTLHILLNNNEILCEWRGCVIFKQISFKTLFWKMF